MNDPFPGLTTRERHVLDALTAGASTTQITDRLGLSDKTVRNHISNILTKLEVVDCIQAVSRHAKPSSADEGQDASRGRSPSQRRADRVTGASGRPLQRLGPVLVAVAASFSRRTCCEALGVPFGVTLPSHLVLRLTLCACGPPLVCRHPDLSEDLPR
jgi:DNA-binding CsgD family transcriptional regulator